MMRAPSYAFSGGLDTESAALAVPPSRLISAMNHEPIAKGYARVDGYEKYSGQSEPSAASYWLQSFDTGVSVIAQGDTVTGATSGASGIVVMSPVDFTGAWGGTAAGTLVLTSVFGDFVDNEILQVGGFTAATANGVAAENGASTTELARTYLESAQLFLRSSIGMPAGEGPVRGVAELNGEIFAWRDNVGATQGVIHKATATGWQALTLGTIIRFTGGLSEIFRGQTITGGTSGATATVNRVVRPTGSWGTDAAGYLVVTVTAGTFVTENIEDGAGLIHAVGSAGSPITINPGGKYHTIKHNFYGASNLYSIYGASGVDHGFEFDGTNYVPIEVTGMPDDKPTRVFEISQHLGFTYPGGSVQLSGTAEPVLFVAILGAAEIGLGTEITDVIQSNETAVVLFGEQKIGILTGRDETDFALQELTEEAGSIAWTAQRIGQTVYLDRRGLRDLRATQAFGNFKTGTISGLIESYFKLKQKGGVKAVLSLVSRAKSHYRLFWDDGSGLTVYMGTRVPEAMPFSYSGMQAYCGTVCEMPDGTEGIFIGAEDGNVYRMDSGNNFDGDKIRGYVMTPFNHFGASMQEDRFFKITVEMEAAAVNNISVIAQFNYGSNESPISGLQDFAVLGSGAGNDFIVNGGGGVWDIATWNNFFWDSPVEGIAEAYTDGFGRNASYIIASESDLSEDPYILQAYTVHLSQRRMKR